MSTNDYVKFVTQQLVNYMDQPKEERKRKRRMRKEEKPPFLSHWFGIIPFSILLLFKRNK